MTTLLYQSPRFTEHRTGHGHPERPERYLAVTSHLPFQQIAVACRTPAFEPLTMEQLATVHDPEVAAIVRHASEMGGGSIEADTVVSPASYEVGLLAAGACCGAVQSVMKGDAQRAFCLVRPPGHHATPSLSMGFCLFNNIALAARQAIACGASRVLIVDWDVHHGNGTQDAFYDDEQVFFLSLHRSPFYPGTGLANETGTGAGLGSTLNIPLRFGISRKDYLAAFTTSLEKAVDQSKPDIILLSAGFDAHKQDPIGSLGLEVEDYTTLTEALLQAAQTRSNGRLVSCLEGGYHLDRLAECVTAHLQVLSQSGK
ncbi:MAG: histone deacetylase [Gemmatales bacterium]